MTKRCQIRSATDSCSLTLLLFLAMLLLTQTKDVAREENVHTASPKTITKHRISEVGRSRQDPRDVFDE